MTRIKNPCFRLNEADAELLTRDVHAEVLKQPRVLTRQARTRLSDRLATEAVSTLLAQLEPEWTVQDANAIRNNNPGYDFLVGENLRVQVKGNTYVEVLNWTHPRELDHPSLGFDVLVLVDIGTTIDANVGRLRGKLPIREDVDYYIVPGSVVRDWVRTTKGRRGDSASIYLWRIERRPDSAEYRNQTRELRDWRNRFDVLERMLVSGGTS